MSLVPSMPSCLSDCFTTESDEVFIRREQNCLAITLNRPKALNALNSSMALAIGRALRFAEHDNAIRCVVVDAAGAKAFCAGGDVREVAAALTEHKGEAGHKIASACLAREYRLDYQIHHFAKPYIALVDGIVMGGGLGLSAHAARRIVSENLDMTMPETAIGLFPDIGAAWFLNFYPGRAGVFTAMTGHRLNTADGITVNFAHHIVPKARFPELRAALIAAAPATATDVDHVTAKFTVRLHELNHGAGMVPSLSHYMPLIDQCFTAPTAAEILTRLAERADGGNADAAKIIAHLRTRCPTSLALTVEHVNRARGRSVAYVLKMDYLLAIRCIAAPDFVEGIRALLIDKDNKPDWQPARIEDITPDRIAAFFAPPNQAKGEAELDFSV
ncbi:MAG: enoyl-CoA hydratase/isomerase family protein, partial [Alphaproteobacteria bacterium]|nr:enoyl-CoA hydratase/isomerase family protein [Alphaproteobacteria bacterium]